MPLHGLGHLHDDPSFRRTPIHSPSINATLPSNVALFAITTSPALLFTGFAADGTPTQYGFVDVIERNRMPDFVGVLRYDAPWGSAQLSAAVHELNVGNLGGTLTGTAVLPVARAHTPSEYGWAVQGGAKFNLPFLAPGYTLYLQGAYAQGVAMYTGVSSYMGSYAASTSSVQGSDVAQFFSDAVLNPFTSKAPFQNAAYVNNLANPVRTVNRDEGIQVRARVQRDFRRPSTRSCRPRIPGLAPAVAGPDPRLCAARPVDPLGRVSPAA